DGFVEALGGVDGVLGVVGVAFELGAQGQLLFDAVQAAGDRGGEGQVGVGVGAGDAVFDPQRRTVADYAEAAGAVVFAPGDTRGGEAGGHVPFIRVDCGGVEVGELSG